MKKFFIMFGFPLMILAAFMLLGHQKLLQTAKVFLAVTNPVETMEYLKAEQKLEGTADKDNISDKTFYNADRDTAYDKGTDDNINHEANPFENFDIEYASQENRQATAENTEYPIAEMTYAPILNNVTYQKQNCFVKNMTKLSEQEVKMELLADMPFKVEKNSDEPQILIMHTHATESYQNYPELFYDPEYSCRDTDVSKNMVSVGKIIADKLNAMGYNTLHDATLHDYPSYNDSYRRSKETVESYLAEYPSVKVVLDVHRDAIERADGTRIKPVVTINGKRYAQVMIISGADNGYLNMPNYKKNLRFASHLQNSMESLYPGFTRPILFDYRNYNQQLTTGSLLIEVGGHANTLEEAQNSAGLIAYSLAAVFDKQQQN